MTTIEFEGLTLHGSDVSDGVGWVFETLTDWYSVPESKTPVRERSQADGAHGIATDWRQSAVPSFTAHYLGESEADVLLAQRTLKRVLGVKRPQTVTVRDALGPTSRVVSVRSVSVLDHRGSSVLDFAVDMVAPDPNRYGPAVAVSTGLPSGGGGIAYPVVYPIDYGTPGNPGRLVTVNEGTEDTYSLLEVTGGLSGGFELTEIQTGRVLRFEREIPESSVVVLNPRTGRAFIDVPGNDVSGFLTRREWWSVPAEGTREVQFTSIGVVTGTPTLTAHTSPAY